MSPILALFIYVGFVAFLFRRDFREKPNVTAALWLPFFWVVISGSRFVSQWLTIFGLPIGSSSVEEGSPIDAVFYFGIIASGVYVLHKRQVNLSEFVRNNRWVTIYLVYCLIAIIWSDFPFVAFKRWIKLFGQPVMVLVLLTEPDPLEAFARLLKRCSYVFIPISILFIKYFPEWGRGFDSWSGTAHNTGIATDKNLLGVLCLICGFFFFWHFLKTWQLEKSKARRNELILCAGFLCMTGWLLKMAQSSTSLVSMLVAISILLFLGFRFVNKRYIGTYLVIGLILCALINSVSNISSGGIQLLGRDPTLTGRTEIWQVLLKWPINPVLGTGFESFWLGDRREQLADLYPELHLNEAHNGYLETYLNLGILGLLVTAGMIIATFSKARRELLQGDFNFGKFRFAYLIAFLVYNCTEAAFRTHIFPFFIFFVIAIDYPAPPLEERLENSSDNIEMEADRDVLVAQEEVPGQAVG